MEVLCIVRHRNSNELPSWIRAVSFLSLELQDASLHYSQDEAFKGMAVTSNKCSWEPTTAQSHPIFDAAPAGKARVLSATALSQSVYYGPPDSSLSQESDLYKHIGERLRAFFFSQPATEKYL